MSRERALSETCYATVRFIMGSVDEHVLGLECATKTSSMQAMQTSTALSPNRDVKRLFEKTYCNQQHNDNNNHRRHRCHQYCCYHHSYSISLSSHFYHCYHYDFQPHSRRMIHLFTTILTTCTSCVPKPIRLQCAPCHLRPHASDWTPPGPRFCSASLEWA